MKKRIKFIPIIIAVCVAIIGSGIVPTQKAEAASNCYWDGVDFICGENSGSNVVATLETTNPSTRYWKMHLQRYENGSWNTIGTRTGYVNSSSPSYRTFTNVSIKNAKMKVYVQYYRDSAMTDYIFAKQSEYWYR